MHPGAIPSRLERRTNVSNLSLANFSPATPFNHADYLVLGQQEALPPPGNMGISIRERGEEGVYVETIGADGHAKAAGVLKGDRILAINDLPVQSYTDLKYALLDRLPGDYVRLLLLRQADKPEEHSLTVHLQLVD